MPPPIKAICDTEEERRADPVGYDHEVAAEVPEFGSHHDADRNDPYVNHRRKRNEPFSVSLPRAHQTAGNGAKKGYSEIQGQQRVEEPGAE